MNRFTAFCAAAFVLIFTPIASACSYHETEPPGIDTVAAASVLSLSPAITSRAEASASLTAITTTTITDPAIILWRQNLTGVTGSSPSSTINSYVSQIQADVRQVAYTTSSAYVRASGVPSHPVGPFPDGNPSVPSDRNRLFRIPRTPQVQTAAKTATGLGAIGVMVNGVPLYNASDARSYNNQNIWHQNANVAEAAGFDTGPGHPSPIMGTSNPVQGAYHYHQRPTALFNQIDPGNTGQHHSPLIGFAFDGFPIYGPYGFTNSDGTGGISLIDSSYQYRNITERTTLPDGTVLSPAQYGPNVATRPLGYYLEDFIFLSGSGDLDQYNGRFTVTPEYPTGTYAYFATSMYPYLVGPSYYGIVDAGNLNPASLAIPADATYYVAPEPSGALVVLAAAALVLRRHRDRS